jgi:hypothetical protein
VRVWDDLGNAACRRASVSGSAQVRRRSLVCRLQKRLGVAIKSCGLELFDRKKVKHDPVPSAVPSVDQSSLPETSHS